MVTSHGIGDVDKWNVSFNSVDNDVTFTKPMRQSEKIHAF